MSTRFQRYLGSTRTFKIVDSCSFNPSFENEEEDAIINDPDTVNFAVGVEDYRVHSELPLHVPQLHDSAFSTAEWSQDAECKSWNISLQPFGHYRSIFRNGAVGNYQNFYDMFSISSAPSFHANSIIPQFSSEEGTCQETTFVPTECTNGYEEYRPFFVESRGYSRSYFYGIS